jgi:hypothetical protein
MISMTDPIPNLDREPLIIYAATCMHTWDGGSKIYLGYFKSKESAQKRIKISRENYKGYDYRIEEIEVLD